MSQTKKQSIVETTTGLILGLILAWVSWVFPVPQLFNIEASAGTAFGITIYFTMLSFFRGYGIRRLFNYLQNRRKQ